MNKKTKAFVVFSVVSITIVSITIVSIRIYRSCLSFEGLIGVKSTKFSNQIRISKKHIKFFNCFLSISETKKMETNSFNTKNSTFSDVSFLCPREGGSLKKKSWMPKLSKNAEKLTRRDQMNKLKNEPLDLIVQDIKGKTWDFYCYRGEKYVIINLWATWCSPCVEELLSLSYFAEKTKENTIVIALSIESPETVSKFIEKAFPDLKKNLKIASLSEKKLRAYFPEDPLPVTYIFNKEGKLNKKIGGARNWNKREMIEIFLE